MDEGSVSLTFDFAVLESWDKDGRAVVEVPKYYRPDLGEGLRCTLADATGVVLEELYCEVQWDWSLVVWGPRSNTLVKTAAPDNVTKYCLCLNGVVMNAGSAVQNW